MQTNNQSALILGATGLVGSALLRQALADERYTKVHVLSRRKLDLNDPKLRVHIVDFGRLADYPEAFQVDDIFCCLGTTIATAGSKEAFREVDFEYVLESAKLGFIHGAQHYLVISAIGADSSSYFFYNRVKGEMEEALRALDYSRLTILRPSFLIGDRQESRLGERLGIAFMGVLNKLGLFRAYQGVTDEQVARTMLERATQEEVEDVVVKNAEISSH